MSRFIPSTALLVLAALSVFALNLRGQEPAVSVPTSASADVTTYDALLQQARAYAAEQSWALAAQAYAEAGTLAPDEEARRWSQLWALDAALHVPPQFDGNHYAHAETHAALLAPYDKGAPRDDFWIALLDVRASAIARRTFVARTRINFWEDVLLVADELGQRAATPENAARYTQFLARHAEALFHRYPISVGPLFYERMLTHLRAASESNGPLRERVWLALFAATIADKHAKYPQRTADFYDRAIALADDAPDLAIAQAAAFAWRGRAGQLPPDADGYPALPVWLNELEQRLSDLELAPAHPFTEQVRKHLGELRTAWLNPRIDWGVPDVFRADEALVFGVGSAHIEKLHFAVYRVEPADWLTVVTTKPRTQPTLPRRAEQVVAWTTLVEGAPRHVWHLRMEPVPGGLAPGLYAATLRGDEGETNVRRFAISSAAAARFTNNGQRVHFYLYDNESAEPLRNRDVKAWRLPLKGEGTVARANLVSDDKGEAVWNHVPKSIDDSQWLLTVDGHPVWLPDRYNSGHSEQGNAGELQLDLFTDRALFRPGETVRWKLIGRVAREGRLEIPTKKFTLDAVLNGEPLFDRQTLRWSDLGTVHGSFVIPHDARPGEAGLIINKNNERRQFAPLAFLRGELASHNRGEAAETIVPFFTVDNFRPPPVRATIEIASNPASFRPGSTATFHVRAEYFSGGPVSSAPVSFKLQAVHGYLEVSNREPPELKHWVDSFKQERTAVTDTNGIATVEVIIPEFVPAPMPFVIAATVQPHGAAQITTGRLLMITRTGLSVEIDGAERSYSDKNETWVLPGEEITYRYRFIDPLGHPVPGGGRMVLHEQRWHEVWLDPAGTPFHGESLQEVRRQARADAETPFGPGWKRLMAEMVESVAASAQPVKADDNWWVATLTAPTEGVFRVGFHSDDGEVKAKIDLMEGITWSPPVRVIAADASTTSLALPPNETKLLRRQPATPGDPPAFLAILPDSSRTALLAFNNDNEIVTEPLSNGHRINIKSLPEAMAKVSNGMATLLHAHAPYPSSEVFNRDVKNHALLTSLRRIPGDDRPGSEAAWTVSTHDIEGRPVQAEIAVAVSDEAVNRLLPRKTPAPPSFKITPRHSSLGTRHSNLWKPFSVSLHAYDPRLGLSRFRKKINASPSSEKIRSVLFVGESFGTEVQPEGNTYAAASSTRGREPSAVEQSLGQQPLPDNGGDDVSPKITVRRHFVSTAFWEPAVTTDAHGVAKVNFTYPDNLTEWRVSTYAVGHDGQTFGTATALAQTSLPFQARLQTPRFLVAGDTGSVAATLVNRSSQPEQATASVAVEGATLRLQPATPKPSPTLFLAAEGEAHTRWGVTADAEGEAVVTLRAKAGQEGDAMQQLIPVIADGFTQQISASGLLARDRPSGYLRFALPEPLDPSRTRVTVHLTPNRARALLDALPFLIDYPYGCVEQTVSRFLPALVAQKTLRDLGFSAVEVERYAFRNERAADARRLTRTAGLKNLSEVVNASIRRLDDLRGDHALYGWWDASSPKDVWMSAYALLGLSYAKSQGYRVPDESFENSVSTLVHTLGAEMEVRSASTMALGLLTLITDVSEHDALRDRFEAAYTGRDALAPAARASLLLAAETFGTPQEREVLLRNLENGARRVSDADFGDTVHWGRTTNLWCAEDSAVEATALTVMALLKVAPKHPDLEPAINWLVLNRRSGHWTNTRDTAFAVFALAHSLTDVRDAKPDADVDVHVNGTVVRRLKLDRRSLLSNELTLSLDPVLLRAGENAIEIRRLDGRGPVYAVAHASSWARGDAVKPLGHLASVGRTFVRHVTRPTLLGTLHVTPTPLASGEAAMTGERVSAHVRFELPHALDYVMIEAPKPAGCEPLNPLSGWDARLVKVDSKAESSKTTTAAPEGQRVYREEHDEKSVFFLHHVPAGEWELRFELRAIHPGDYRALPVHFEAMYAPEVRANSDARRVKIAEAVPEMSPSVQ